MNTLNTLGKNVWGIKNFFKNLEDSVRQEQKEIFFHKRSWEEETDYFNFVEFLFSKTGKSNFNA